MALSDLLRLLRLPAFREGIVSRSEERRLLGAGSLGRWRCLRRPCDEAVERKQQRLRLGLLVVDLLRNRLEVAEPLGRIGVTGSLRRHHLRGKGLDRLRHILEFR